MSKVAGFFTELMRRYLPDPFVFAIGLTLLTMVMAMLDDPSDEGGISTISPSISSTRSSPQVASNSVTVARVATMGDTFRSGGFREMAYCEQHTYPRRHSTRTGYVTATRSSPSCFTISAS